MMSKLQSLYFKLNPENEKHAYIIRFFDYFTSYENEGKNKIDLLYEVCKSYDKSLANKLYGDNVRISRIVDNISEMNDMLDN